MSKFGVGLDIGTTTIHAQLVDLNTGDVLDTFSALNNQRSFGADVISRISAAQYGVKPCGKLNELYSAVNIQAEGILQNFINKYKLSCISKCVVSGNTTMLHLFCGVDPSAMGASPYTPVFLEERYFSGAELSLSAEQIILLPGVSAFIGADITAGLALINIINNDKNVLFIDIGTNGEIVVWKENEKQLLCCSAAAGPCFEEAEISCGLNASDFIDTIAQMKKQNLIDKTGVIIKENGVITQKDVRQFQLAKSAIFSGIKMICKTAGLELKDIGAFYIAGGLGLHLNLDNAVYTGLLPQEFADNSGKKTKVCGNTSLEGAVKSLTDAGFMPRCRDIISCAKVIDLANDKYFAAAFEHNMWF